MQYTYNLAANAVERFNVVGSYVKLVGASGLVRVTTDFGRIDLLPGRGFRLKPGQAFTYLTVQDLSGAANSGLFLAGDFDLIDDRVTGSVEIVDGGRTRTLQGVTFLAPGFVNGVVGQFSAFQIYNPAGSGLRVVIKKAFVSTVGSAGVNIGMTPSQYATVAGVPNPTSKLSGAAAITAINLRTSTNVASGQGVPTVSLAALGVSAVLTLEEPVVLLPGFGMWFEPGTTNQSVAATIEGFVEPLN